MHQSSVEFFDRTHGTLHTSSMSLPREFKSEIKKIIHLAWPIIVSNLSHILVGLTDSLMVGQLGKTPLAACSFASAIMGFVIISSFGMSSAIGPLVARKLGEGKNHECGDVLKHGLLLNFAIGSLLLILVQFAIWKIDLFSQPLAVQEMADRYLQILAPTVIFSMLTNVCRQFSQGLSFSRPILHFSMLLLLLNAFFNWLFIFGHWGFPAWGLDGAAAATFLSRLLALIALLVFLFRHPMYRPYLPKKTPSSKSWRWSEFKPQLSLGVPSSLQYSAESAAFTGAAILMGWVGATALAAHQIALNMASMTFMVALGTSVAVSIRVGKAYGQGDFRKARIIGFSGIGFALAVMSTSALIFLLGRHWFPTLYIENREVIELSAQLLVIAAAFQLFDGTQAVAIGALRGIHDVKWPTIITFISYWAIALPLGYFLAFHLEWGGTGIWWGKATGLSVAALSLSLRFYKKTSR